MVRGPAGEWVMYWTALEPGAPVPPICHACTDGNTPADAPCAQAPGGTGPTYMSYAASPSGPWSKPAVLFQAQRNETNMDTNLAVTIRKVGIES